MAECLKMNTLKKKKFSGIMMSLAFFLKMLRFLSAAEDYKEKVESVLYPFCQAEVNYVSDDQLRQFFTAIDTFTLWSAYRHSGGASESDFEEEDKCFDGWKKNVLFSIFPPFFFRFFPSSKTGKNQKNERNSIKIAAILNENFRHDF